ncbi:short-chain dehydrogenase reductase 4 [Quercus suber]|uniref:Short-chain dehydrogenase reductase 4 n=1 Tax=Quercus suber TaxID=58331 RepID=A0AAW0L884_QUESU
MAACVKHAAKAMVEGHVRGSIVCIMSISVSAGYHKFVDYVMSKHAVLGLVRCASMNLGVYRIHVNCVLPRQDVTDAVNAFHGHTKKTHRTDVQCENCIDTIKKYKIVKARVSSSNGTLTLSWIFFNRLDSLIRSNVMVKKPTSTLVCYLFAIKFFVD